MDSWRLFPVFPNASMADDNLVLNGTSNAIDVTFDRDMDGTTFTNQSILRMVGTNLAINGPRECRGPREVVVLDGIGDDGGRERPVNPRRHVLPQLDGVGERGPETAVDGVLHFRRVTVGELE